MARVWLPPQSDPWLALREPALLVPGRKPVGPVAPRPDVVFSAIPENPTPTGLVEPVTLGISTIISPFVNSRAGFSFNQTGTTEANNGVTFNGAAAKAGGLTEFTVISLLIRTSSTNNIGVFGNFTGSGAGRILFRWASNNYQFYVSNASSTLFGPATVADGLGTTSAGVVVGRYTGSAISVFCNGVKSADVSASGTVTPDPELRIGSTGSGSMIGGGFNVAGTVLIRRALSDAEIVHISRTWDLWRFVQPAANDPIFIGTAAGGPATITGTGALAAGAASVAGTAERELTATGALSSQAAAVAGTGAVSGVVTGTGVLAAQAATVAGTAERELTATGALSAQTAAIAGTAEREITGTGAPASTAATMSGTGTVTSPGVHTGTGAVAAQAATMTGAGILARDGTGVLAAGVATINATGIIARDATGALTAQAAAIAGTGTVSVPGVVTGTGVLAGLSAAVSGTGTVQTPDGWTPVPSASGTWSDIAAATSTWTEI